jgi:hypothetical protein
VGAWRPARLVGQRAPATLGVVRTGTRCRWPAAWIKASDLRRAESESKTPGADSGPRRAVSANHQPAMVPAHSNANVMAFLCHLAEIINQGLEFGPSGGKQG